MLLKYKGNFHLLGLARLLRYQLHNQACSEFAMTYQIEKLLSAFSDFQTSTQSRPDGGLLFKLRDKSGRSISRVLSYHQLQSSLQVEWVIGAIKRDLAMQPGELPAIASLQSQHRFDMPTYISR